MNMEISKGQLRTLIIHSKLIQISKLFFYRANSKYKYGDFKGAIKDYEKLNLLKEYKDQIFYNIASSQLYF